MKSSSTAAVDPSARAVPWGTVGTVAVIVCLLAPAVYRLTWRPPKDPTAPADDVTIEYMAWGNPSQLESDREVIRRFNERCSRRGMHEHVELVMPPAGGYTQKLLMMFAAGTAPDVCRVDHYDFASMAVKGNFYDLTDLAAYDSEFRESDFHPATMRENKFRGRLYGLNVIFGGWVCFYNADLFRHAGLADPYTLWKAGKWDWAAFDEAAKRLTERDAAGRPVTFGMLIPGGALGPSPVYLATYLWRFGGHFLSPDLQKCLLDSPADVQAVQYARNLIFKDKVCASPSDLAANRFSFEGGNVAMTFDTFGNTPQLRTAISTFDWDIAPTPSDAANPYTLVKGNQVVVTAKCKHPREAWEWIKFLTSEQTEKYLYGDTFRRDVPTRLTVLNSPAFLQSSKPPFHVDALAYTLDHGRELPIDETYPTWTATLQSYIQQLFVDDSADTATVMKQASAAVDIDLHQLRKRFSRYDNAGSGGSHVR